SVLCALLIIVSSLGAPRAARAQVGSTTDIITGTITSPDGKPIVGARVDATSIETGVTRSRTTNDKGQYTILFPDGGGSYRMAAAFSVAGQRPDQNQVTLDGLSFLGGTNVPTEAVRQTRVITNTYDVARGQFTGGQVATTTRGGTNSLAGSFSYALRDPHLEWATDQSTPTTFGQGYTQHQLSGGIGGPIIQDKLFYFGAIQVRRRL